MDRDKRPAATLSMISRAVGSRADAPSSDNGWSRRGHRMAKASLALPHCDIAAAVAALTNELLNTFPAQPDGAALLDRLRRRLSAVEVVLWACENQTLRRVLRSGPAALAQSDAPLDFDLDDVGIQRLRNAGTVLCRAGDVTGLEHLVPAGVQSFAAAATVGGKDVTCVLVVGWSAPVPPCATADAVSLQVAAALLAGTLTVSLPAVALHPSSEAVFASLPDPVAVVDRAGRIITANASWIELAARHVPGIPETPTAGEPGTSINFVENLRRAAMGGVPEAAALADGIMAVSAGSLDRFQTMYPSAAAGTTSGAVITVAPLRHPHGGAVVAYSDAPSVAVGAEPKEIGEVTFQRLVDELPIPVFAVDTQGHVLQANQQWWNAVGHGIAPADKGFRWTDALDTNAKAQAAGALHAAVKGRAALRRELRLQGVDGRYRWWALTLVPRFARGGAVDGCVGVFDDVTATRHMQATLGDVTRKLIAAQEAECARIARELHDDLGQQVALLATQLDMLTPANPSEPGFESARGTLQTLSRSLTSLSHQLHPGKIRLLGVARTLEGLCRELGGQSGVRIDFGTHRVPRDLPESCGVSLFRVAQEALRNALKHSGATAIVLRLGATRSHLTLRVTDNGRGFDSLTTGASGIGLLTMRERVELVNGTLAVEPVRPHGTTIRVVVPIVTLPRPTAAPLRSVAGVPRPVPLASRAARPAFSAPASRSSA